MVEGPKMRGKATVDVGVLGSFTIKFGPDSSRQFKQLALNLSTSTCFSCPKVKSHQPSSKFVINALRIKFQKGLSRMMTAKNVQEARAPMGG